MLPLLNGPPDVRALIRSAMRISAPLMLALSRVAGRNDQLPHAFRGSIGPR